MNLCRKFKNQKGAVLVLVAILMSALIAFIALAIDFSNATVILNELQNAADAGALAGAQELWVVDPVDPTIVKINTALVKQIANEAGMKNLEGKAGADIKDEDIHVGHWSFTDRKFTPNDAATTQYNGTDFMSNLAFINAVQVTARRSDDYSPLARWFHPEKYRRDRTAVAVIGQLSTGKFDVPLSLCRSAITNFDPATGNATCPSMQLSNSNENNAGWTNFVQPCNSPVGRPIHKVVSCAGGEGYDIWPLPMHCSGGQDQKAFSDFRNCWLQNAQDTNNDNDPDMPWDITLPVLNCAQPQNTGSCQEIVGTVMLHILWITRQGQGPTEPPTYYAYPAPDTNQPMGTGTWDDFVSIYKITSGEPDKFSLNEVQPQSVYMLPDCQFEPLTPGTLAQEPQRPRLVE